MNPLIIACPDCHTLNRVPEDKLRQGGKCGRCKGALFQGKPVNLTEAGFANHLKADIPVLVDFWAEWCGPCQAFAPTFEQAAAQLEPRVRLAKVNTEQAQNLAAQYGIRSIPTLALFRGGREIDRLSGALLLQQLLQWVTSKL
jgi:thioredoxin 2